MDPASNKAEEIVHQSGSEGHATKPGNGHALSHSGGKEVKNGPKKKQESPEESLEVAKDQCLLVRDDTENDGSNMMQTNGDLFSPDLSEVVTVICKTDAKQSDADSGSKGEKDGCDGSDTHSDSIETLEEESPHDVSQEQLSESLLKQIRLTSKSTDSSDVFEEQAKDSAFVSQQSSATGELPEDSRSTDSHEVISETTGLSSVSRPESLSLPHPLQYYERNRSTSEPQQGNRQAQRVRAEASGGHQRTRSEAMDIESVKVRGDLGFGDDMMSRSLPHGTLMRKGEMVEFVADDLTEIIRRSSPMSKDSSSMGSRRSSQRSIASSSSCATSTSVATSSGLSRSPSSLLTQSPDAAPPIDPGAVMELEMAARRVADNVDHMMGNLRNNLHKMSAITVGCLEAYKTSVDITCDSVDSSIKSMYALMAKCEELNLTMEPVKQIGAQIKEIKRLLDRFEEQLSEKS